MTAVHDGPLTILVLWPKLLGPRRFWNATRQRVPLPSSMLSRLPPSPARARARAALAMISIIIADSMTNLGKVEFGEIAKGAVEPQQRVNLAVPAFLVLVTRDCKAGQRPPGFHKLFHVGQVGAGHGVVAGAFDASPGILPEGSVPSRAAHIVPRDKERIAAHV